jgi:hypothetical protein
MQYCSIEEAWGDPVVKKRKKGKKLYETRPEKYIEDTSFLGGTHDPHCTQPPKNKNHKNRFSHSRTNRDTYRKNKTRTPNVQLSYDQAAQEYRNFQMENNQIKSKEIKNEPLLVEGFESGDELNSIEDIERTFNDVKDVDEREYVDTDTENIYSPSTNYATETEPETEPETEVESDDEEVEKAIEEAVKNQSNESTEVNIKDIDYRLNNLNRNVNMLLKKMDDSDFFDDDSQDNIHDLILFILFGVFMIFVLDTVHKIGKN